MNEREKYINDINGNLKKYKGRISKLESLAKKYHASNRDKVLAEGEVLKRKYKEAENIYEKLKSSTQENFEEIKKSAIEVLDSLSASYDDFTHLVTYKDIARIQEGLIDYTHDALSEAEDYAKKHPFTVITAALGVGVLIGLLMNRTRS